MKLSRKILAPLLLLGTTASQAQPATPGNKPLHIDFIDVEGGQATLFVPPGGDSLLIDTGWPGNDSRDAKRIVEVAHRAGLKRIDYVLITHFHDDHVGGVPQLSALIPIGTFIDHGPNHELDNDSVRKVYAAYQQVLATSGTRHIVAKPGDILPIRGLHVEVLSADGKVIPTALPGAGQPNPACNASELRPPDTTENGRSLGVHITYGRFKAIDLGDLTWDRERDLVCPNNRIGAVDLYIVSHHGWYQSSSPALVDALHAPVAIMDNGAAKGGSPSTYKTLTAAPGLQHLWQLHYSEEGGPTANTDATHIANPHGEDGHNLEVTANRDGTWKVINTRTGYIESYPAH